MRPCRFRGLTLIDVIVLLVLVTFMIGAVWPMVRRHEGESPHRVRCASNLKQIGTAMLMYMNGERDGALPRTNYDPATASTVHAYTGVMATDPFARGGPVANDVTAALFMLLRTQDIGAEVFNCDATQAERFTYFGTGSLQCSNFPSRQFLSYSYANPYPSPEAAAAGYQLAAGKMDPAFAVMADMNPGAGALKVTSTSQVTQIKQGNSRNHDQDGQNVLYTDGHVEFQTNPLVGVRRDNIYTFGASGIDATGADLGGGSGVWGSPTHANDSILLPTDQDGPTPVYPPPPVLPRFTMTQWTIFGFIGVALIAILLPLIVQRRLQLKRLRASGKTSRLMLASRSRGVTLTDLCILLAIAAIFSVTALPAIISRSRETADRVKCASNLKQLGTAILMYSNAERSGAFPRTRYDPVAPPTQYTWPNASSPFAPEGPNVNDVTASIFLLLRTQDIGSEVFVCPASGAEPWRFDGQTALSYSNFPGRQYLSYSYANPFASATAVGLGYKLAQGMAPDFAVMADMNPGAPGVMSVRVNSTAMQTKAGNTLNHEQDGQNVLYTDGHVEFQTNPFVGISRDNIYTFGVSGGSNQVDLGPGTGVSGSPVNADDSVLLPTALDVPIPARMPGVAGKGRVIFYAMIGGVFIAIILGIGLLLLMQRRRQEPKLD